MKHTSGEWKIGRTGSNKFEIQGDLPGPLAGGKRVAVVDTLPDARLIAAAVNACLEINPDNPQAVADSIKGMYKALKAILHGLESVPDRIARGTNTERRIAKDTLARVEGG